MHVTSGTTGDPVAVGFTQRDHEANSAVGGEAFRIADARPDDVIAHCLNYALYAGGIADHMALEASGATVVPMGTGQSRRLLELIPRLGITGALRNAFIPRVSGRPGARGGAGAERAGPAPHHHRRRAGGGPGRGASEIERSWGATVSDTFGMSDIWSTMAGACGEGEGMHLTVGDHAVLELVDPDSGDAVGARGRRERRARLDAPAPRGLAAPALPLRRPRPACGHRHAHAGAARRGSASTAAATTCCACRR